MAGVDESDKLKESVEDMWERHHPIDPKIISQAADGFVVDIHGTRVFFKQNEHFPVIVNIWVNWQGDAGDCIGSINIAKGDIVTLGNPEDSLADEVDRIRQLPASEIDAELERLAYKLNPAGRKPPKANKNE